MKVSTRGHYGLRAVVAIAKMAKDGVPVSVSDVAESENISDTYLEQLVSRLRRAGILRSYRGAHGGYELLRDPDTVTVSEILSAAGERVIFPADTKAAGASGHGLAAQAFWNDLKTLVNKMMDETTIGDLIRRFDEKQSHASVSSKKKK